MYLIVGKRKRAICRECRALHERRECPRRRRKTSDPWVKRYHEILDAMAYYESQRRTS